MDNSFDLRVNEILTANGLDFTIEKLPMFAKQPIIALDELGNIVNDTPYFGLLNSKSGEILNTVKSGYTVSQNAEIVELVLRGIAPFGSQLSVQNAGSLNGGRRIFLQLAIEGTSKVGDDTIKRYVTIIDSNDGSTGLSIGIGDFTMSCSNQFFHFYKAGQSRMRHTASLDAKIKEIPNLIELALEQSMSMVETYNEFATVGISNKNVHDLVKSLVGVSKTSSVSDLADASSKSTNAMNKLYDMIRVEVAQKGMNVWGLHSGVTRWTTHEKSAPKRENGRIESAMLSTNYRTNQQSLAFAKELLTA
jgi:phage/plasmid-like protein (TIGR03299 family)